MTMDHEAVFQLAREEHEAFVAALGELTLAWSDLETVLYKLLRHYAGVSDNVGRALFSGTRARAAMAFITAIADNTNMEPARRSDLEEIFAQVSAINQTRDFLFHHVDGSEQQFEDGDPRKRLLTDALRVSRKRNAKVVYVGSDTLAAMCADCIECCWRLHPHWDTQNTPFRPGHGGTDQRLPWQFTPPQPVRRRDAKKTTVFLV